MAAATASAAPMPPAPVVAIDTSLLTRMQSNGSRGSNNNNNSSRRTNNNNNNNNNNDDDDDAVSVATTALASEVGSFIGRSHDAFLRSITFQNNKKKVEMTNNNNNINTNDDTYSNSNSGGTNNNNNSNSNDVDDWDIQFADVTLKRRKQVIQIESIGGCVAYSKLKPGDQLKSINGKKMGPSFNAERAMEYMQKCWLNDGYLSVAVGNDLGRDILVQATVIKPRPDMTYEDLGMVVWIWGQLCIKSISKNSLFKHTVLKSADHIVSINDIDCERVSPEGFAHIINELPNEITIVVKRGKQRWTGKFG